MSMKFNIDLVGGWARDRNLINGSNPKQQFLKFAEEGGELFEGVLKCNKDMVVDAVGDVLVVTTILLLQLNKKPELFIKNSISESLCESFIDGTRHQDTLLLIVEFGWAQGQISAKIARGQDVLSCVEKMLSVLQLICARLCIDFAECYRFAYLQIKDRRGQMVDGVFIKEGE